MPSSSQTHSRSATVEQVSDPLYDYGKLYESHAPYKVSFPASIDDVKQLLEAARQDSSSIRVRASGHTFNGCSLPQHGEVLLRTNNMDWYRFEERGTITVGAGALVWDIRDLAEENGFDMPVYNGGWAGPTLGGYINSGGFGKGSLSDKYGGLWENILSITLVDGLGKMHIIDRSDDRFKWIFGSYGQLGVLVEAKLKLLPNLPAAILAYPKGMQGNVPKRQQEDPSDNDQKSAEQENILFWFSLLISPEQESHAWRELEAFCHRYAGIINPDGGWAGPKINNETIGYHYNISFHNFTPPLLYPFNERFLVVGIMSFLKINQLDKNEAILAIEANFIELAIENNFKLYLQAENIGRNINYREYYGDLVFDRFEELKHEFDPKYMINPGFIFPRKGSLA